MSEGTAANPIEAMQGGELTETLANAMAGIADTCDQLLEDAKARTKNPDVSSGFNVFKESTYQSFLDVQTHGLALGSTVIETITTKEISEALSATGNTMELDGPSRPPQKPCPSSRSTSEQTTRVPFQGRTSLTQQSSAPITGIDLSRTTGAWEVHFDTMHQPSNAYAKEAKLNQKNDEIYPPHCPL